MAKAGTDVGKDQVLVNLDVYRGCLKVHGWTRETGGKVGNPAGFSRGLEDEGPMPRGQMPKQVGETEGAPGRIITTPSRELLCRQTYLQVSDWRRNLPDYQECLAR